MTNRDKMTSTHIYLYMGRGNLLVFFDFSEKDTTPVVRDLGGMHHVALKVAPAQYSALLDRLDDKNIDNSIHGDRLAATVYLRDLNNTLIEVKTAS